MENGFNVDCDEANNDGALEKWEDCVLSREMEKIHLGITQRAELSSISFLGLSNFKLCSSSWQNEDANPKMSSLGCLFYIVPSNYGAREG
ncbi:hypothetical protein CEXT_292941 [Caerostris extrusa]|uniref:Uncharacterized protein n=1 Tax=Caerostris extrusa TaxID=172846 RepID=A0AAV4Y2F5_CAEEX|nr:hypothetical protein CEXT_292941 [Caerostris extrusa]